ncbi:hypothetical protein GCM10011320_49150 [Neoroseomonas lacus]|uniref:Uncharacterized protein n=1 Tax=Neoroseomonas lacus TaxID=287609 RepID=A0A917NWL2_9PROT|nr:hypothetical protein GCM10011320_49150 [Neoroseomonas lacus]
MQRKLEELEARREQLKAELQGHSAVAPVLHPNLAEVYARRAAVLRDAIEGRNDPEVLEAARALVDKVIVSPGQGPDDPPEIELVGHLVGMLRAGGAVLATEDAAVGDALKASTSGSGEGGHPGGRAPPFFIVKHMGRRYQGLWCGEVWRGAKPLRFLCRRIAQISLDRPRQLQCQRLAAAVHGLAHADPHPAFRDAILLDIGFLLAAESDADAALEQFLVKIRAGGIGREPVG